MKKGLKKALGLLVALSLMVVVAHLVLLLLILQNRDKHSVSI